MRERSERISKLLKNRNSRESYIRSKLNVLLPSQIKGLRLKREMLQEQLGNEAEMKQSRISAMERPGEVRFNIETLIRLAAALKVGLKVEFVPFSEMLKWENSFSQDQFAPVPIDLDTSFLNPDSTDYSLTQELAQASESSDSSIVDSDSAPSESGGLRMPVQSEQNEIASGLAFGY